jgi:hypothetical protein
VCPIGKQQPLLGSFILLQRPSLDHCPIVVQKSRDFRILLFLLFLLNKSNAVKKNLLYTSLTPSLFIEILLLSQDRSCLFMWGISNLPIPTFFRWIVGTVYFFIFVSLYVVKKHSPNNCVEMAIIKANVCGPSSVIKFVKMKCNWIDIKWWLASTLYKITVVKELRSKMFGQHSRYLKAVFLRKTPISIVSIYEYTVYIMFWIMMFYDCYYY